MTNRSPRPAQRTSLQKTALTAVVSIVAAATLAACQPSIGTAAASTAESAPAPVVTVAPVLQQSVQPQFAQVGRVEAAQRVEIRPRVAGHIEAALFREGEIVRAGQPLFRIDTRPFDAALARAQAELQLARAKETLARSEAERAQRLQKDQAIAAEEAERRAAAYAEAQARSAAAQAAVQVAALDREFAVDQGAGGRPDRAGARHGRQLCRRGLGPGAAGDTRRHGTPVRLLRRGRSRPDQPADRGSQGRKVAARRSSMRTAARNSPLPRSTSSTTRSPARPARCACAPASRSRCLRWCRDSSSGYSLPVRRATACSSPRRPSPATRASASCWS